MATPSPDHPQVHELIRARWSRRAFAPQPVPQEILKTVLEAASWAASSRNEQPWRYLVIPREDSENHAKLVACLSAVNQQWAPKAPVLLLAVAELTDAHGKLRRHAYYDVGQANAQLCLQATALGLNVRTMGGFDFEAARAAFAIPEGFDPVTILAIGYPASPDVLPPDLRERELAQRTRRPLAETVFGSTWGKPAGF
jgi:nitroreductase